MSYFITPEHIAEQLQVSVSLIQKMIRASEYAVEVKAGKRQRDDVPISLQRYLDCGFPIPKKIGKSVRRVRMEDLDLWLKK